MYWVSSMTINWRSQLRTRLVVRNFDGHLHAGQPVFEAGDDFFDQRAPRRPARHERRPRRHRGAPWSAGAWSGRSSRLACSSISATSSACAGERWPISPSPVEAARMAVKRRLVGVRQAVEHRGAQLLGAALGLDAALVGEGAIAVEGDRDQRRDGVVGQAGWYRRAPPGCRPAPFPGAPRGGPGRSPDRRRWSRSSRRSAPFPADQRSSIPA